MQQAFIDEQAFQCGYCLNGWVLIAKVLLDKNPQPTEQQMSQRVEGLICRCGSHARIFAAVRRAADAMKRSARMSATRHRRSRRDFVKAAGGC